MSRIYLFLLFIGSVNLGTPVNAQEIFTAQVNELVSAEYNMAALTLQKGLYNAYKTYTDENTILYTPIAVKANDYLESKPKLPDVMTWKPLYAKVAKSNEWGFTTGHISWQNNGSKKQYGEYLCIWKRDRKGLWKIAYRAISEHGKPSSDTEALTTFENASDNRFQKLRSKARIRQREDIVASTDQLFATVLKADNTTAFKEFLTENSKSYFPTYLPINGQKNINPFLSQEQINIESTQEEVDRAYSGELAYTSGTAQIRKGDEITNCRYLRIWELQENKMWKVSVDMYIKL